MPAVTEWWGRRGFAVAGVVGLLGVVALASSSQKFMTFAILGLVTGSVYAIAASGLVVTYTTSGVFNFAHGAIGMLMAFAYWELTENARLPAWLAFVLTIAVIAPTMGAMIERMLIRRIDQDDVTTSTVVTVALLVLFLGIAQVTWPPTTARTVQPFFASSSYSLLGVQVSGHQMLTLLIAVLVAGALYVLLNRTRLGTAMQAVVDDPDLAALNGAPPTLLSTLSWAIGGCLAGLAGVLLASAVNLEILTLTLLVVNAFAAGIIGRLRSLPLTIAGALGLGMLVSFYTGYQPRTEGALGEVFQSLGGALPILALFAMLLVLPAARFAAGRTVSPIRPRVPSAPQAALGAVAFVVFLAVVTGGIPNADLARYGEGLALATIMISLVPLTGYAGQLSLAPMTLAGVGAFAAGTWLEGSLLSLLVAALVAAAVGAIVALPALRLRGLYLALTTMAFAVAMDTLFFRRSYGFGRQGSMPVPRIDLPLIDLSGERAYVILIGVLFAVVANGVLVLKRSRFGRRLSAMRDSPQACVSLGLNLTATKLQVFALSAGIAGIGGALLAGLRGSANTVDFRMERGLVIVLLAVIGGVFMTSGPLLAGLLYAGANVAWPDGLGVIIGAGALVLARHPNGLAEIGAHAWRGTVRGIRGAGPSSTRQRAPSTGSAVTMGRMT